jgi:hypothetical protein
LPKTKQKEGIAIIMEVKDLQKKGEILREDKLFKFISRFYEEPLSVYDDTKKKNVFGLNYSDRELLGFMLTHYFRQTGQGESSLIFTRIPSTVELYKKLRDIARNPPGGKRDLIYVVGRNVLRKYPLEEVQERVLLRKLGRKVLDYG